MICTPYCPVRLDIYIPVDPRQGTLVCFSGRFCLVICQDPPPAKEGSILSPPPEQTLILKNCGSEASSTYCEWSQSPASHLAQAKAGLLQKLGVAIEGSRELFL